MLSRSYEPLRVRHQSEHPAGPIRKARDRIHRPIRIDGIVPILAVFIDIFKCDVFAGAQLVQRRLIFGNDFALAVCDGQIDLPAGLDENAFIALGREIDPPVLEFPAVVICDGDVCLPAGRTVTRQDSRLDQHLETVADSEHKFAVLDEFLERLEKMMYNLVRKDLLPVFNRRLNISFTFYQKKYYCQA